MASPDYQKVEKIADDLIQKYGYEHPFVNVFVIAENEGLQLKNYDPDDEEFLKSTAGFFHTPSKTIYVNKTDPPNRKTFTIAHELGHYLLKHATDEFGVLPRWRVPGIEKEAVEKEADAFAANLLVPKTMLKKVMSQYSLSREDVFTLAGIFGVSDEVMRYRVKWL